MAESVLSSTVKILGALLNEEAQFLLGVEDQVRALKDEFRYMMSFLKDADSKQDENERVRQWVADIRDLLLPFTEAELFTSLFLFIDHLLRVRMGVRIRVVRVWVVRIWELKAVSVEAPFVTHPIAKLDNPFVTPDRRLNNDEDVARVERKRKSEETRIACEVEAHEKWIRKEFEKQDMLRRKREGQNGKAGT